MKGPIGIALIGLVALYGYFIWQTQVWTNFDIDYVNAYNLPARKNDAGLPVKAPVGQATTGQGTTGQATAGQTAGQVVRRDVPYLIK